MRALIVDDARLARQELRTLLGAITDVELVGEADDVVSARTAIATLQPDVLFLDIQLPSGTGFDVLDALEAAPCVVFTTAYDQYAVRAFEANALDYLVKPVEPARLAQALQRVRAQLAAPPADIDASGSPLGPDDRVFLRDGERCWFVTLAEINRIVVDGNYSRVWFRNEHALLARSLAALETRLNPAQFFRANRNTLVNLRQVRSIEQSISDGYLLTLKDGSTVDVSRRQARELRDRLAL